MTPEVFFQFYSYDRYGSERNLSLVAGLLELNASVLKAPLRLFEVTAWFPTERPPKKTLESLYHDFNRQIEQLPKVRFSPKKKSLTIDFRSSLGPAEKVVPQFKTDHEFFMAAFGELEWVMSELRPILKKKRGLHAEEISDWVHTARLGVPDSQEELELFEESEKLRRAAERAQKSPWELLGLDWSRFHSDARRVLDDPFFWEVANDLAPNGNDTGADLLEYIARDRSSALRPVAFLDRVFERWGMKNSIRRAVRKPPASWDKDDEIAVVTHDEAAIALPFALIKLWGHVDQAAISVALEAIERQRSAADARGWNTSAERAAAEKKIEDKLRQVLAAG